MSPVRVLIGANDDPIPGDRWEQLEDSDRCKLCGWSVGVFTQNLARHREIVKRVKAEHETVCPAEPLPTVRPAPQPRER